MRHRRGNKKLALPTDQRIALLRSLCAALFKYRTIKTTFKRAKEAQKMAEKLITLAKRGDLHARRLALKELPVKDVVKKLFSEIADSMKKRDSGYTRVTKIGRRRGDAAVICCLELVD